MVERGGYFNGVLYRVLPLHPLMEAKEVEEFGMLSISLGGKGDPLKDT
jgi:hypothetical protein